MNEQEIKNLSNYDLVKSLESYFEIDRKTTHLILLHLKEIQVRKLFADRGFPNLFTMLIQHFRLSESAANQRLQALRLMNDVPEVENRLIAGDLNLSTLAMAQRQIRREEKVTGAKIATAKKTEIIQRICGKTLAQAEKELIAILPESAQILPTYERRISESQIRISLTIPDRVKEKLEQLKNHWAAANPSMDYLEIIERSLDIALAKVDPLRKAQSTSLKLRSVKRGATDSVAQTDKSHHQEWSLKSTKRKTYYSIKTDKILWQRAGSQCEYTDKKTNKRCSSKFGLERDHIVPRAKGGSNAIQNLRLLCRAHNQLEARRHFGINKIP